jgi:hypothetical protein
MTAIDVKSEPLTYRQDTRQSYFQDLVIAKNGDLAAEERLARHASEMSVEVPKRDAERRAQAVAAGVEFRVNPNRVDGTGGFLSPPLWLIDHFAGAPRVSRTLSALMPNLPLPRGVSEVKLPRLTTGTHVFPTPDGAAVPSRDIVDAAASQPVTTLTGMADVALQLLEQSPGGAHLDFALFTDLAASYDGQLENALINGAGDSNTFAGILKLTTGAGGVNAVTYTAATPTTALTMPPLGQAAAQIGNSRYMPPEVWLMRTGRWSWIASGDVNLLNGPARLLSWPVVMEDVIPATLGGTGTTNGTQDVIIAMRPSDGLLLESEQATEVLIEPLSGVLMARLRLRGYACAIHRFPTGIAVISGTGTVVQSGY